jgi:signal transduction histidine kinase
MKERMKSMGGSLTIHGALEHSRGTRIEALLLLPAASPGDES